MRPPDLKVQHALFGGTFDPIHLGHLHLIRHVLNTLSPETLWVCPARRNPLKADPTGASSAERLEMTTRAVATLGDPRVQILDFELKSKEPSFTLLTVRHLKQKGAKQVTVVMGNEVYGTLPQWHEPKALLTEANLLIISRELMTRASLEETLDQVHIPGLRPFGDRWEHDGGRWIAPCTISALPFSATAIREAVRRYGVRPEGLADGVWDFIKERGLYTDK